MQWYWFRRPSMVWGVEHYWPASSRLGSFPLTILMCLFGPCLPPTIRLEHKSSKRPRSWIQGCVCWVSWKASIPQPGPSKENDVSIRDSQSWRWALEWFRAMECGRDLWINQRLRLRKVWLIIKRSLVPDRATQPSLKLYWLSLSI